MNQLVSSLQMVIIRITVILLGALSSVSYAQSNHSLNNLNSLTSTEWLLGVGVHEYQEGWFGQQANANQNPVSPKKFEPALIAGVSFYRTRSDSPWFYGMGANYLLQNRPGRRSHNQIEFSLLKMGYRFAGRSYQLIGELGVTAWFEKETSYGNSYALELKTDWELFSKPLSIKYSYADTDYEPRGQSLAEDPLRRGYTRYIALLMEF